MLLLERSPGLQPVTFYAHVSPSLSPPLSLTLSLSLCSRCRFPGQCCSARSARAGAPRLRARRGWGGGGSRRFLPSFLPCPLRSCPKAPARALPAALPPVLALLCLRVNFPDESRNSCYDALTLLTFISSYRFNTTLQN